MIKTKVKFVMVMFIIFALLCSMFLASAKATDENPSVVSSQDNVYDEEDSSTDLEAVLEESYGDDADEDAVYDDAVLSDDYYSSFKDKTFLNYTIGLEERIIDGNTWLYGNNVVIDTEIAGDLYIIANTFTITERACVYGNVFVLANEINLDGTIYDLYANCIKLNVGSTSAVYRDLRVNASKVTMLGKVGRNMIVTSNDLVLTGTDSTDAEVVATIYGDLKYSTIKNILIPEGAVVGTITPVAGMNNTVWGYALSAISAIVFVLAIWGLMMLLTPKFVEKISTYIPKKLLLATGLGVVAFIVVAILFVVLKLIVIADILACALAGLFVLLSVISVGIVSVSIGGFVNNKMKTPSKVKSLGFTAAVALVLWAICLIPYVGFVVKYVLVPIIGVGMLGTSLIKKED